MTTPAPARKGWLDWLRPAFAAPALALLLLVVGYQNFVSYPKLHHTLSAPQVMPWAAVNVGTYGTGEGKEIPLVPGQDFLLLVRIPPEEGVSAYIADLYNPSGKLQWSLPIPVVSAEEQRQDRWSVKVPGANWTSGTYTLKVHGTTATGEVRDLGKTSVDLKIQ